MAASAHAQTSAPSDGVLLPSITLAAAQQPQAPAPQPQAPAAPQDPAAPLKLPATVCGLEVQPPPKAPPAGTPTVTFALMPCFEKQGGAPVIDPYTYLHYIELKNHVSVSEQGKWVPYTDATEQIILADFKRLWATSFLDDLEIQVKDIDLGNDVVGKLVVYSMEERQRVKIVDYVGSTKIDQGKIEEELKKQGINLRIDTFIDPGMVRRVSGVVRQLYADEGYQFAEVKPTTKEVAGGPKLVHLTFNIDQGPKVKIRDVEFVGNEDVSDRKLEGKMKENKSKGWLSFITGGGTFK